MYNFSSPQSNSSLTSLPDIDTNSSRTIICIASTDADVVDALISELAKKYGDGLNFYKRASKRPDEPLVTAAYAFSDEDLCEADNPETLDDLENSLRWRIEECLPAEVLSNPVE